MQKRLKEAMHCKSEKFKYSFCFSCQTKKETKELFSIKKNKPWKKGNPMHNTDSINEQIRELKKKITSLEWDIPNLKSKEIRLLKEKQLLQLKEKLKEIQTNSNT